MFDSGKRRNRLQAGDRAGRQLKAKIKWLPSMAHSGSIKDNNKLVTQYFAVE